MDLSLVIMVLATAVFSWMFVRQRKTVGRELSRFRGEETDFLRDVAQQLNAAAASLADRKKKVNTVGYHSASAADERARELEKAGLETLEARGKFLLIRIGCGLAGPLLGLVSYSYFIPYYATITTLFLASLGLGGPIVWLKMRAARRTEEIQRELPLVLDLTNLGTSAGWDVSSALERVIDALYIEFPDQPLIKELKKSRWATVNGSTWEEALQRAAEKLGDDTVRRSAMALSQAIKQGGDRSSQLDGIAQDAQRSYYTTIDKRMAGMPVKALLITMLLMVAYFVILLAPAVVQVRNTIGGGLK